MYLCFQYALGSALIFISLLVTNHSLGNFQKMNGAMNRFANTSNTNPTSTTGAHKQTRVPSVYPEDRPCICPLRVHTGRRRLSDKALGSLDPITKLIELLAFYKLTASMNRLSMSCSDKPNAVAMPCVNELLRSTVAAYSHSICDA